MARLEVAYILVFISLEGSGVRGARGRSSSSSDLLRDPSTGKFLSRDVFESDDENDEDDDDGREDEDGVLENDLNIIIDSDNSDTAKRASVGKFISE